MITEGIVVTMVLILASLAALPELFDVIELCALHALSIPLPFSELFDLGLLTLDLNHVVDLL